MRSKNHNVANMRTPAATNTAANTLSLAGLSRLFLEVLDIKDLAEGNSYTSCRSTRLPNARNDQECVVGISSTGLME